MRRLVYAICLLCAHIVSSFSISDPEKDTIIGLHHKELIDSNIEAFDGVREINGQLIIVDSIPCWSFAQVRNTLFTRVMGEYYVDCSTCAKAQGRPIGHASTCTSIRKVNVEKYY